MRHKTSSANAFAAQMMRLRGSWVAFMLGKLPTFSYVVNYSING
jgi:hypothetical protein